MRCAVLLAALISAAGMHSDGAVPQQARRRADVRVLPSLVYAEHGGQRLLLDAYLPPGKGPFPAVLVVHGGAWRMGSRLQLLHYARHLAEHGYAAFAIDYRLAPRHRFPAQIHDCRCALRWVARHAAEYQVDAKRLGAIGYSAGGHLVALLAAAPDDDRLEEKCDCEGAVPRLRAVAPGGAPCDFRNLPADSRALAFLFGGTRAEKPDLYEAASPAAHVSEDDPPMFFFHGSEDSLVERADPEAMVKALKDAGVEAHLHIVEGAGHILAVLNLEALERATEFFDRHLKTDE